MDRPTLRGWVIRYNEQGIDGLSDRPHGASAPLKLTVEERTQLAAWVGQRPDIAEDDVVRWRLRDLRDRILARFFKTLAFSHISVRPRHPQADAAAQETQKNFPDLVAAAIPAAAQGKPIELWWQDEARVGQQGSLMCIWVERGSRSIAPRDQRYKWRGWAKVPSAHLGRWMARRGLSFRRRLSGAGRRCGARAAARHVHA
jgi:transposase